MKAVEHNKDVKWDQARPLLVAGYQVWLEQNRTRMETTSGADESLQEHIDDLPIALRKGKRKSNSISDANQQNETTPTVKTPSGRRKKVRFSDSAVPSSMSMKQSTGLTPAIRRASLGTPRPHSPYISIFPESGTIQFTPFRQALDERIKRRIRRNGLSEELNNYETETKAHTLEQLREEISRKDKELETLRDQLAKQDEDATQSSQGKIDEVEAELEVLRQSFNLEQDENWADVPRTSTARGSDSGDTIQIYEDDDAADLSEPLDQDGLTMGLELESARQAKQSLFSASRSFEGTEMNFADSPSRPRGRAPAPLPATPRTFYHELSKQLKTTTSRAEDAELALKALQDEIMALGFGRDQDGSSVLTAIVNHFRQARLELERTIPGETAVGFDNARLLPEMLAKLKQLTHHVKDREAELKSMRDQQKNLKGNFEHAIVAAEKANAKVQELEASLDQGAEEMLQARIRAQKLESTLLEKEKSVSSLIEALDKYRADVSRLEQLVLEVEAQEAFRIQETRDTTVVKFEQDISDLEAKAAAEMRGRKAAEESAVSRLNIIHGLEESLAKCESQIQLMQDKADRSVSHHAEEVGGLSTRISNLSTALASANAEVDKLKITKTKLEERVKYEVEQGALAVESIQNQIIRSVTKTNESRKSYIRGAKVRVANWELSNDDSSETGPMTPSSMVRFVDMLEDDHVEGEVEVSRGKKGLGIRRRYDSGIGMSPLNEDDEGLLTPEMSSEGDVELTE